MGGNAVFRIDVHFVGADLYFQWFAAVAHDCGVERLVHPEFWGGNVVFKSAGHGCEQGVHHPDGCVAIVEVVDEDSDAHQVEDFVEVFTAHDHFLVDRPVVFWSAFDFGINVIFFEPLLEDRYDFFEIAVA